MCSGDLENLMSWAIVWKDKEYGHRYDSGLMSGALTVKIVRSYAVFEYTEAEFRLSVL